MAKTKKLIVMKKKPIIGKKKKGNLKAALAAQESVFSPKIIVQKVGPKISKPAPSKGLGMSPCAYKYACAIADPWSDRARGSCIPMPPATHSLKVCGFTRFTFYTGSSIGVVLFTPSLANDSCQAYYSSASTFAGTDGNSVLSANNTLSTGISRATCANLPFTSSQFTTVQNGEAVVQGRIVSFAYKVTYTGTTLNEGGVYYNYVAPTHDNIIGNFANTTQLGSGLESDVCGITRVPCSGVIFASNPNEMMYASDIAQESNVSGLNTAKLYPYTLAQGTSSLNIANAPYTDVVASNNVGGPVAIVLTTGASGNYLVELIIHAEFIGSATAGMASKNTIDPEGAGKVMQAAQSLVPRKMSEPQRSITELMVDGLRDAYNVVKPIAISAVAGGIKAAALAMLA